MKNILLLTNIFPNNDPFYDGTKVCYYFAKEWTKMGHNVHVIHFDSAFPTIFCLFIKIFRSKLKALTGSVLYTNHPSVVSSYTVDGIDVLYVPIPKLIPHKLPSMSNMTKAFKSVCSYLSSKDFVPDIVTSHFIRPQLQMLWFCKQKWPMSKTCFVLHCGGEKLPNFYPNFYELKKSVDVWGFRSKRFQEGFESMYGKCDKSFVCYSGIPNEYILNEKKQFTNGIKKFIFVGSLYKNKNVDVVLKALNLAFPDKDFVFDIVGTGAEMNRLKRLTERLGLENNVCFHGYLKRDVTQNLIEHSDCLVLVSSHEAFGMVYLESMAKGCITIATKGQGGDGLITDCVDGFLCESGNPESLAVLLINIKNLSNDELCKVSDNAKARASELTNSKVALHYISHIS